MLNSHTLLRGETSAASHPHTSSASDVFGGHHLPERFTYLSREDAEELAAKHVTDEATSSVDSQSSRHERPFSKGVLLNKQYAGVTLNGHHWPESQGQKKESGHLGKIFNHKSFQSYTRQPGGVLSSRKSWKDYNSLASIEQLTQVVKGQALTLTSVSDDVFSLGNRATTKAENADGEFHRSSTEGRRPTDYRPPATLETRGRTTPEKSDDISADSATLPPPSAHEVPADEGDAEIIQTPDPDLQEQKEEIEEAIARDATLIIVFSCLAVASLLMWRIVRCIAMHKLKKHEKKLEADKASSV